MIVFYMDCLQVPHVKKEVSLYLLDVLICCIISNVHTQLWWVPLSVHLIRQVENSLNTSGVGSLLDMNYEVFLLSCIVMNTTKSICLLLDGFSEYSFISLILFGNPFHAITFFNKQTCLILCVIL